MYKVLEGASYCLSVQEDPVLEAQLDRTIAKIAATQESDGYLYTPRTVDPNNPPPGTGAQRWSEMGISHELYNMGYMMEAAVAHYQATGKRSFLDVAVKAADFLVDTFGPSKRSGAPGHQEVEIGLIKLYRIIGRREYLGLAQFFLDQRGRPFPFPTYPEDSRWAIYNNPGLQIQWHRTVLEQDTAAGHAVRATYMYSAMADVAALLDDPAYTQAIDRIWDNVVECKLYLTGGIGSHHGRECFGDDYELPNLTGYGETCAAIGNVMWNHRLFLLHGNSKYIDILERTLYNGMISGVALGGRSFFYSNPLASDGKYSFNQGALTRKPWFGCACCPGNITRFVASIPGYIYAQTDQAVYVNLYIQSKTEIFCKDQTVRIQQTTHYLWDGGVQIRIYPQKAIPFTLSLRVPGWVQNKPVPSYLYRYAQPNPLPYAIQVNDTPVNLELQQGYIQIDRLWHPGDTVTVSWPMPIRRVLAHAQVRDNQGKVAVERGPLVYCAEAVDHGGQPVLDFVLPYSSKLHRTFEKDLLGGLSVITGKGYVIPTDNNDAMSAEPI